MRLFIALIAALLLGGPKDAHAQAQGAFQYHPMGYCQITSLSSAVAMVTASCSTGSVPAQAVIAEICVSGAAIRYRDDGTAPTTALGIPVGAGTCFPYAVSAGGFGALFMIQQTSGATVDVSFYN